MISASEVGEAAAAMPRGSGQERARAAQRERVHQVRRWMQYDKDEQSKGTKKKSGGSAKKAKKGGKKGRDGGQQLGLRFTPSVTLLEAAARNDVEEVRSLLRSGVSPDLCNEDGLTALHQCCIDDYSEVVALLLAHRANVNPRDSEGWTPLHAAAACGNLPLVQQLLGHGADLLAVNVDGDMPYDICEEPDTLEHIEGAMAAKGITQETIDDTRSAVERHLMEDVRRAIANGDSLEHRDAQGATLLHVAAAHGCSRVAELLLEQGMSPDARDEDGWEPLHAAAYWGQMQVAEVLVCHGANLKGKTNLEETALDLCENDEMRKQLLEMKTRRENILRTQGKPRASLQRRTSSVSSRGKLERKASLGERTSLYRKEHQDEAKLWQERQDMTEEGDQENRDPNVTRESPTKRDSRATAESPARPETNGKRPSSAPQDKVRKRDSVSSVTSPERAATATADGERARRGDASTDLAAAAAAATAKPLSSKAALYKEVTRARISSQEPKREPRGKLERAATAGAIAVTAPADARAPPASVEQRSLSVGTGEAGARGQRGGAGSRGPREPSRERDAGRDVGRDTNRDSQTLSELKRDRVKDRLKHQLAVDIPTDEEDEETEGRKKRPAGKERERERDGPRQRTVNGQSREASAVSYDGSNSAKKPQVKRTNSTFAGKSNSCCVVM
ncbi:unnamed protein product [Lampetra fluviatilis]